MDSNFIDNGKDILTSASKFVSRPSMSNEIARLSTAASKFTEEKQNFEGRDRFNTGLNLASAYLRPASYIAAQDNLAAISARIIKRFGTDGQIAVNRAMGSINRVAVNKRPSIH